jgi:UDP-N-acetylmuramoylalanine--D-glutamate ligase
MSDQKSHYGDYFAKKRITLMGLGVLGRGLGDARFLAECGAELIVTDLKNDEQLEESVEQLRRYPNIIFHLGAHRLEDFQNRDLIIKAAGVPIDSPFVAEAKKNNIPVRMSSDLFVELARIPTIGITGTRGKSTTTHLIAHVLRTAGKKVLLGGNIQGVSTLSLLPAVTKESIAVLELDSWQLQGFGEAKISPNIAVFTTFMPDHMNYYKNDMRLYFADKANIFLYQEPADIFIVGEQMTQFIKQFGYEEKIRSRMTLAGSKNMPTSWKLKIPGEHNRYNAGLAVATARAWGLDESAIRAGVESFEGVAGRLQMIREIKNIKIYNDTTATVPEATAAALEALDSENKKNVHLIMGGADKGLDMSALLESVSVHAKKVYLLAGTGTERIKTHISHAEVFTDFATAVKSAYSEAKSGEILLLSPAFASFGMFKNEYDRGDQFNTLVSAL